MAEKYDCHSLLGKVAIITGSSSGIGASTALLLASKGFRLCLSGRNEEKLKNVAISCEKTSPSNEKPVYVVGDLRNEDCRRKLVEKTIETYKKIDVLVNNVGGGKRVSFLNSTLQDLEAELDINLKVPYHLCQLCTPYLIQSKGNIVNVSSFITELYQTHAIPYLVSKSAVEAFTKSLSVELGRHQVRVNAVSPGAIITDTAHIRHEYTRDVYLKMLDSSSANHVLGRVGKPEEVAQVIGFLATDAASFVTGSVYSVNGGVHLATAVMLKNKFKPSS